MSVCCRWHAIRGPDLATRCGARGGTRNRPVEWNEIRALEPAQGPNVRPRELNAAVEVVPAYSCQQLGEPTSTEAPCQLVRIRHADGPRRDLLAPLPLGGGWRDGGVGLQRAPAVRPAVPSEEGGAVRPRVATERHLTGGDRREFIAHHARRRHLPWIRSAPLQDLVPAQRCAAQGGAAALRRGSQPWCCVTEPPCWAERQRQRASGTCRQKQQSQQGRRQARHGAQLIVRHGRLAILTVGIAIGPREGGFRGLVFWKSRAGRGMSGNWRFPRSLWVCQRRFRPPNPAPRPFGSCDGQISDYGYAAMFGVRAAKSILLWRAGCTHCPSLTCRRPGTTFTPFVVCAAGSSRRRRSAVHGGRTCGLASTSSVSWVR